ncbi:MAG: hypothetical protein MJ168_08185 [Clostridia bacterium]|nr:hypothetical protein [Clostridia bacterium]
MAYIYDLIVIGIDQSYTDTGIAVIGCKTGTEPRCLDVKAIDLHKIKTRAEKRRKLHRAIKHLIAMCKLRTSKITIMCERARLHGGGHSFINIDAIGAMCELTALIVDVAYKYDISVYSVDTRAWKSAVVGSCKKVENNYGVPPEKYLTVKHVVNLGLRDKVLHEITGRKTKGTFESNGKRYAYNNDACDAVCIGLSYFKLTGDKMKLET